jgi:hypothetical protein
MDTDCTNDGINFSIVAFATDTGSGSEDIDVIMRQQIAGSMTMLMNADADGDIEIGDGSRTIKLKGETNLDANALRNANYIELEEITTPGATADHAKIYAKNDNKLYFQDGAGTEHEVKLV